MREVTTYQDLYDISRPELARFFQEMGEPGFRVGQVWRWIYRDLATDFSEMTDLPRTLRSRLEQQFRIGIYQLLDEVTSADGETRKSLLELADGEAVECVLMLYERRRTACISTQVGCPVGCAFCATGQAGFRRNLSAGEIVLQAMHLARLAREFAPAGERPLTNVVYMGMGEPFLNYDAVWHSVLRLTDAEGFGLGARHITISTVGVPAGIRRLAGEGLQVGLAISLHAPTDDLRAQLVPLARRYPIDDVMDAVREYIQTTHRRVSFEYALIDGLNDDMALAGQLATLLHGLPVHVNLIPVNPTEESDFQPSPREQVNAFAAALERRGIPCTVRLRRGIDISAGCGQLRSRRGRDQKRPS